MIVLYTTQFCGYCAAAKRLLSNKGLGFEEIDVGFDAAKRAEMTQRAGGVMPPLHVSVGQSPSTVQPVAADAEHVPVSNLPLGLLGCVVYPYSLVK